jgi:hypothetical protein
MFASLNSFLTGGKTPIGQQAYTTPGTYSWTCPDGVFFVSVVCVGGGAGGGGYSSGNSGGGALGYKNNISVNIHTTTLRRFEDVFKDPAYIHPRMTRIIRDNKQIKFRCIVIK